MNKKLKRIGLWFVVMLPTLYVLLLIPGPGNNNILTTTGKPFSWNKDGYWKQLENDFTTVKQQSRQSLDSSIDLLFAKARSFFNRIDHFSVEPGDTVFNILLNNFFTLASMVAAQPQRRDSLINYYNEMRNCVKRQSQHWDMNNRAARNTVYQILYGMRAAVEEVLLQSDSIHFEPVMYVKEESSSTAATRIFGITVHSGDLLVSRGGAEVSALISRGNDYPGNFSHVALIYIDQKSNTPYLVEAHIEKGVAVSTVEQYVKDKKLRFMVLRLRADLLQMIRNPQLPQQAAKFAYDAAMQRHIPYDFKMNFYDTAAMFCSEVGSYAYNKKGIQLWQAVSTISSPGVVNWLEAFGVENFVTQMPADLEYDPQLSVVAEWRDPETLYKDHIDNAVMDVLLEEAEKGKQIEYNTWQLPFARLLKGYCIIKNFFGKPGVIPEGMSATQALKNQSFVKMYQSLKKNTSTLIGRFTGENNYKPPYWQMIELARQGISIK